jgi:ATP-dependent Clp protease protease subunit
MLRTRQRLYEIMSRHTGKDMDTIAHDCERDKWLDADESVAYGVADRILQHLPEDLDAQRPKQGQE